MRFVITGGTGLIGTALTKALLARGDDVVVLTRDKSPASAAPGGPSFVTWTPEREGPWMDIVDGADAIVHLAGASVADERWTEERKRLLRSSRVESTRLLTQAIAKAANKPKVFLSASAVGIYGTKTADKVLTENAPPGDDFLSHLAVDWEAEAVAAEKHGVRVVLPRLGLVLGRGGGLYGRLAPIFRRFVGGPVGDGTQYMPWVHLRDVVSAFDFLLEHESASGAFNLSAPEPVTMNVFARELGASLRRPAKFRVPPLAIKLALGSEAAEVVLTGQRAIPKRLLDAGFRFQFADVRAALDDLA